MTDDEIETELSQLSDHELIKLINAAEDCPEGMTRREELALGELEWRGLSE